MKYRMNPTALGMKIAEQLGFDVDDEGFELKPKG